MINVLPKEDIEKAISREMRRETEERNNMITIFERSVRLEPAVIPSGIKYGEWGTTRYLTVYKGYDLNAWDDDFDDIMRKIGCDLGDNLISINGELYHVDRARKTIRKG